MIDESNDKENKSCIILARILDAEVGNVKTRFLDMPIVNIGTAANIFSALNMAWILVRQWRLCLTPPM